MGFGNLFIRRRGGLVEITFLTRKDEDPIAVFTEDEIPALIEILKGTIKAKPKDVMDLV